MLLELIESGIEAQKQKERQFFDLAERFRNATDAKEVKRLGDQMGRMIFHSSCHRRPESAGWSDRPNPSLAAPHSGRQSA